MRRVRQIERFSDECHEIQLQQLTQLLDEAKNTEYGRKHGFARLQDINDFKKAVPLVRYEDLRPYIMQMVEGKSNVLWRPTAKASMCPLQKNRSPDATTAAVSTAWRSIWQ